MEKLTNPPGYPRFYIIQGDFTKQRKAEHWKQIALSCGESERGDGLLPPCHIDVSHVVSCSLHILLCRLVSFPRRAEVARLMGSLPPLVEPLLTVMAWLSVVIPQKKNKAQHLNAQQRAKSTNTWSFSLPSGLTLHPGNVKQNWGWYAIFKYIFDF
jgi:hypothetical protein